jgi:hypothetical protein
MNDLDAFVVSETKEYGEMILTEKSSFSHTSIADLPDAKSNNVSFMKVEVCVVCVMDSSTTAARLEYSVILHLLGNTERSDSEYFNAPFVLLETGRLLYRKSTSEFVLDARHPAASSQVKLRRFKLEPVDRPVRVLG